MIKCRVIYRRTSGLIFIKAVIIIFLLTVTFAYSLTVCSCREIIHSGYVLELPDAPEAWVSLLGEPNWRIEWLNSGGIKQTADIPPFKSLEIGIPAVWSNPVTAWPYWPEHNLIPGFFRPAGALFPFDANGGKLNLSWEAGPDTVFYWELIYANGHNYSRIPANFDWPRFRALFHADTLNESVRKDPWLVNWRSVAERTASGNFDTRRLVSEAAVLINIPLDSVLLDYSINGHSGPWYGISPFAEPYLFPDSEPANFPVRPGINVWISAAGILRANGTAWVFTEMRDLK